MQEVQLPSILAVACGSLPDDGVVNANCVDSGRRAIELMQLLRFDLLAISPDVPDVSLWTLLQRVRSISPWQKWVLVGPEVTPEAEVAARAMGAIAVIDDPGDWRDVYVMANSVRSRSHRAMLVASA